MSDASIVERTVTLPSGVTLEFAYRGKLDHEVTLFIHGWPDSWRSFEWVMGAFGAQQSAVAVSLRGFGGSDVNVQGWTPEDFAGDVIALADHLGLRSLLVVGHSMGSVVAQRIALDRPDLVRGLVLIGGFARLEPTLVGELSPIVATLGDPIDAVFVREFQASTLAQPIAAERFEQIVRESSKARAAVWRAAFAGLIELDLASELRALTMRTLLIWGDQDALIPRSEQDFLCATIRGARLEVYRGGGHSPNWEEPERVAADIHAFARQLSGPITDDSCHAASGVGVAL